MKDHLLIKLLFLLPPEVAHHVALFGLDLLYRLKLLKPKQYLRPITCMGITFPNGVGLAAGFDKNGAYIEALQALGFGFIEIGTLTPCAQTGNPRPRLFRRCSQQALINRMGFNNDGVLKAVERLQKTSYRGVLGISIGKNKATPLEKAAEDYKYCMAHLWPFASYFAINISSPNTPELRNLQTNAYLSELLHDLKNMQATIHEKHHRYIPLVVKISPDLSDEEVKIIAKTLLQQKIDGVIATNTSIQHQDKEPGGLSGAPITALSNHVLRTLHEALQNSIPLIGCGGIMNAKDAQAKKDAGASLLQIYTGFIYQGSTLIEALYRLF